MFIKLRTKDLNKDEKEMMVNTNQIAFLVAEYVHMSNGAYFEVLPESLKELSEVLFGGEEWSTGNVGASEKTQELLNELNKLLG